MDARGYAAPSATDEALRHALMLMGRVVYGEVPEMASEAGFSASRRSSRESPFPKVRLTRWQKGISLCGLTLLVTKIMFPGIR